MPFRTVSIIKTKSFVSFEMRDIWITAGRKIVDDRYFVSFADKLVGQMAADKARSACD